MAFVVNSAPGAGLRFEKSVTFDEATDALAWAAGLSRRGMRLIRIRDTARDRIYEEAELRAEIAREKAAD